MRGRHGIELGPSALVDALPLALLVEYRNRLDTEAWGAEEVEARMSHRHYLGGGIYCCGRVDRGLPSQPLRWKYSNSEPLIASITAQNAG